MLLDIPPEIYRHEPSNYIVRYVSAAEVKKLCFGQTLACARPKWRLVVILEDVPKPFRDLILLHEKAHLNGWIEEH